MMTLDEMKLAVCEKLPNLIGIDHCGPTEDGEPCDMFYWKSQSAKRQPGVFWPTEGLQVCHEAEKLLTNDQIQDYFYYLNDLLGLVASTSPAWIKEWSVYAHTNAAYEQRLEALCRVWHPEKF